MAGENTSLFTVLIALVSAIAGAASALASWKAASTAQTAATDAARVHRQSLIRDIVRLANEGVGQLTRIMELIATMKKGIGDLERFGGSPDRRTITKAEEQLKELVSFRDAATQITSDPIRLKDASDDDLMQGFAEMENFVAQANPMRANLESVVSEIEVDITFLRNRKL